MASPAREMFDALNKTLSAAHTIDWVVRIIRGEKPPENAPVIAKMAYGIFGSGDEVVQQILFEELSKLDPITGPLMRDRVIRFLKWLRTRGGKETKISQLIAWYYFNGFRVKLAKMHEASRSNTTETVEKKDGSKVTTVKPTGSKPEIDAGVVFLKRIAEIIGKGNPETPEDEAKNYLEVIEFLQVSGVPVMPEPEDIQELINLFNIIPRSLAGANDWARQQREVIRARHAAKPWWKRMLEF